MLTALLFFLVIFVLVLIFQIRKKGITGAVDFFTEHYDLFKKIFDIAVDSDDTNRFLAQVKNQYLNGYYKTDLEKLKKVLLDLSSRCTNSINHQEVLKAIEQLEEKE